MKFIELGIRNFLSYGNNITKIDLDFTEPTLIVGENHDSVVNGEICTNGAGKSTILNALSYALYGNVVTDGIKVNGLINNINKKNLYVYIIFEDGGIYYRIERWRKNKKMGGDGVKISSGDSVDTIDDVKTPADRGINEYIVENIIKIPFEIFVRIIVFTPSYKPFLNMPVTHTKEPSQTSILEEIFGFTELTEKSVLLKEKIKQTTIDIKTLTELNDRVKVERQRYIEQLDFSIKVSNTWDDEQSSKINTLKASVQMMASINFDEQISNISKRDELILQQSKIKNELSIIENKLTDHEKNVKEYDLWVTSIDVDKSKLKESLTPLLNIQFDNELNILNNIAELNENYEKIKKMRDDKLADKNKLLESINTINAEMESLLAAKCPYCKQEFHENQGKLNERKNLLSQINDSMSTIDSILQQCTLAESAINDELKTFSPMFHNETELNKVKLSRDSLVDKLDALENATNPYKKLLLNDVECTILSTSKSELRQKLDVIANELRIYHDMNLPNLATVYDNKSSYEKLVSQLDEKNKEVNPHIETIQRLQNVLNAMDDTNDTKIDELNDLQFHQEFLLKLLSKKDSFIRQALLDVNLPVLNDRLQYYLDFMSLPHKVSFTKEMMISISQFNNEIDFANLSGGQKARINIALAFAFRDVVQARYKKINFFILDECLDTGLSNLGIKLATKMIKNIAKDNNLSMYIITHRDEIKSSFNKKITAVLKGGITTLQTN